MSTYQPDRKVPDDNAFHALKIGYWTGEIV